MFVAYCCSGCSMAPLTQYNNNEIKQELTRKKTKKKNFSSESDKRLYIDMRRNKGCSNELEKLTRHDRVVNLSIKLKVAATKKMRVGVIAYSQSEYWYANTNKSYIMTYKDCSIAKDDDMAA